MKGKIFNAQEVQSILNGSKVMFREIIRHKHLFKISNVGGSSSEEISEIRNAPLQMDDNFDEKNQIIEYLLNNRAFKVGETIFVKESFLIAQDIITKKDKILYLNDLLNELGGLCNENYEPLKPNWKPAQHMKQEHSRLTLKIKNVKVERLAEISRGDCMAEGCPFPNIAKETNPKEWFKDYWNSTHKKLEEKFEANPWIFAYEFEVVR